jgi:uncharacterized circularly permuted ATP-grasp superfamily protein
MTRLASNLGERSLPLPKAPAHAYDEYADAGELRAHQRRLHDFLQACSQTELERLNAVLRQRIASHEVTFNMLGSPNGSDRSWQLDPLPLVIARDRWEQPAWWSRHPSLRL